MFKKVLIVDDVDLNDIAVMQVLNELDIPNVEYTKYCDDAVLKIRKAIQDQQPYELLISDLSFKSDYKSAKLNSGEELIEAVKVFDPSIKVIAFSIEDKSYRIKSLFNNLDVDGFVIKGRYSIEELKTAIKKVYLGKEKFLSAELSYILQDRTTSEIDNYDIQLLKCLSVGVPQETMEAKFKELDITPNSKSTIEKRINKLKIYFKANNTVHLVSIAKDLGIV